MVSLSLASLSKVGVLDHVESFVTTRNGERAGELGRGPGGNSHQLIVTRRVRRTQIRMHLSHKLAKG